MKGSANQENEEKDGDLSLPRDIYVILISKWQTFKYCELQTRKYLEIPNH